MCLYDLPHALKALLQARDLIQKGETEKAIKCLETEIKVIRLNLQINE